MNTFGIYISRLRSYAKMTQEQLAEKMEVSKTTIQNWESGRTKVKPVHIKRLAYLFNVTETKLIEELNHDNDSIRKDNFPYFLIEEDDELIGIIKSLHLNLNQQELFGLICLYCSESLKYISEQGVFDETITKIPYEFICKVGSIQYMNLCDGLKNLLKYVTPEFLLKVLKLYPDELFDVTRLSKDLIIEFLNSGHFSYDEYDFDDAVGFDFNIDLKKASVILPLLEKQEIHLFDGEKNNEPLSKDVPKEIIDAMDLYIIDKKYPLFYFRSGLERVTNIRFEIDDKTKKWFWSINDLGCELLQWLKKKE